MILMTSAFRRERASGRLAADTKGHRCGLGPDAGSACQLKGTEMHINPAIVGALSALVGAIIGAAASLAAAIYTQRYQNRLQRVVREISKRETVYADFIMSASSLLLKAYVTEGFQT